jgi:ubiquinone/menaquinone biosynthesis C-methylase UbiE
MDVRLGQSNRLTEPLADRILELAFGTGNMLLELHTAHYRPIGLDLSPTMIRIARRKLHKRNMMVPLVRGRAQQLPFADESFDTILCTFPAEFIVVPDTLGQIARVLCPGGRAVVTAMSTLTTQGPLARFLEWLYWITGQRGPLPNLQPQLERLGLESWTKWKQVKGSAVLLVMIEKPIDG